MRPPTGFKDLEPPQANFNIPSFGVPKSPNLTKPSPSLLERTANYNNQQCPHCLRKFSDKAALRHIPICPSIGKDPPKSKTTRP